MWRISAIICILAAAAIVTTAGAADRGAPAASREPPATAAPATQPVFDGWTGEYRRLDYLHERNGASSRLTLVKVGDHYQLRGGSYDSYEFLEDKPGLLWDRKHILGSISRGKLTYEAAGRTGALPPQTVLNVQFCYEFFLLIGDAQPVAAAAEVPAGAAAANENEILWKRLAAAAIEKFLGDPAQKDLPPDLRQRLQSLENLQVVERNETARAIEHLQDFAKLRNNAAAFDAKHLDHGNAVVVNLFGPAGGAWQIGVVFDRSNATVKAIGFVPGK